jgi:hypothetical protein
MDHYLLRSNLVGEDLAVLWERYLQLAQIEAAFKTMKSELAIRPLYHQLGHRVEAHILAAFLAYCLLVTMKNRLQVLAPGLAPKAVLEQLASTQMLDVWLRRGRRSSKIGELFKENGKSSRNDDCADEAKEQINGDHTRSQFQKPRTKAEL